MSSMYFQAEADRIISNARRLGTPAIAVATALEIKAPQPDHEWHALCCYCLGERGVAFRLSFDMKQSAGDCTTCPVSGCDVLVALLPI